MIHLKEITNEKDFVEVNGQNIPLTQTFAYGLIQKRMSRNIKNFQILNDKSVIGSVLIVEYPLFRSLTYWYAPYGPILSNVSEEIILSIKSGLTMWAKKNNVAFVRLDFTFIDSNNSIPLKKYFTESLPPSIVGAYFQPRDEWYTAISGTPEEILSAMHSKTRYSVRLAEKKGIKTVLIDKDLAKKLPAFLELMKQTSVRNGFALHNNDYYKYYFEELEKTGKGFLIEAFYENELLASHVVFVVGDVAHYVFGASSDLHKDLCAPYLAHFNAMLKAKDMGAKYYNFGAVSVGEENKKWQGLSSFKQKFGGEVVHHLALYDLVLKPFWYYVYITRKLIKKYI